MDTIHKKTWTLNLLFTLMDTVYKKTWTLNLFFTLMETVHTRDPELWTLLLTALNSTNEALIKKNCLAIKK